MTKTIQLPIDLRNPRATSLAGNAYWALLGLTAWDAGHWHFLKDVEGKVYGIVRLPVDMAGTPNAKIKLVICANATSGVTSLAIEHKSIQTKATAESLNPALLTAITTQDITVPGTAYDAKEVSFTVTETLAAEDELVVSVFHDGDKAEDTLATDTILIDAILEIDIT
jgi:hypothetical protein